ncbi:hypothetical protein JTE90_017907 [Oedothorax gibbosus]|uniref:FIT family protein n=1 Tax=Oedothorax gibbosus TaxID=931172 RepID=A0AAV6VG18_9ARAC|nr:hypothetical protein JTE90_017907 [Oedothorax gibbosus]
MAGVKRQSSSKDRQRSSREQKWQTSPSKNTGGAGKKPLPEPTSVQSVIVMLVMHVCRRIVLFETELKIAVYLGALFFGSLICDFAPIPRSYFSRKSNFLNQYFVKWGWAWTFLSVSVFLALTSWVYCCGNREKVKKHFWRLVIGSLMWFSWTKSFVLFEAYTSTCMSGKYNTKTSCLLAGSYWRGFDISGHAFLLIYCSLLIAEEAKSIRGWERIGDLIRNEEFDDESPLKPLTEVELTHLRDHYFKFTPYVRSTFIWLTLLSIVWDVMLVATIIYFHSMVQKVVGGSIAILTWYFTYKWWFKQPNSPGLPGQGCFKYTELQVQAKKISAFQSFGPQ